MKGSALLATFLAITLATPALGATTKVPTPQLTVKPLAATISTQLSAGDEVAQMMSTSNGIVLLGTLETTTSPLITAVPLGGSDGFIVALDTKGNHLWDLRLGTSGDDVATAGLIDNTGNIWVAGASAASMTTPAPGLNQLMLWEISPTGTLLNTFKRTLSDIDVPTSITQKGVNLLITGASNKPGLATFSLTATLFGKIGAPKNSNIAPAAATQFFTSMSAAYIWQNYVTTQGIKGVSGIPLHQATTVLIESTIKGGVLKAVFSLVGSPLALRYQLGIGVIALTQGSGSYYLTIIHTK